MVHVVVGVIANAQNEILVTQRPPQKPWCGYWEFPGGKKEPKESTYQALVRELKEELAIDVISAEQWTELEYTYPEKTVLLDLWIVKEFNGILTGLEGQAFRWVSLNKLKEVDFLPANKVVLDRIISKFSS